MNRFWEENSKLTVEEIENQFPPKIAKVLIAQKEAQKDSLNTKQDSFWIENAKLSVEEIKSNFECKIAKLLLAQKRTMECPN